VLATLGTLALFVGIVGAGLAIGWLSAPLDGRGNRADDWMLGAFVIAVALATAVVVAAGRATRRRLSQRAAQAHAAIYAQRRAEQAAHTAALQEALRAIPELARYASIVDQAPWLASVDDARRRESLVQRLSADPRTAPHADRAFRGEEISEALIAHWQDPSRPLACEHLRPLEAAMRALPGGLVPITERQLRVNANLDAAAAALRTGASASCIDYRVEALPPGRGSDNYQGGQTLRCTQCGCTIEGSAFGPSLPG
jgi:hypothetical protein